MVKLSTNIAGVPLSNVFLNAAGVWCRYTDELQSLLQSGAGALITKSATYKPREGNPSPRYIPLAASSGGGGSISSIGLANEGYEYYLNYARHFDTSYGKPLFVSLSGLTLADNVKMVTEFEQADTPCILEINFSCPNVPGKPQLGYDIGAMDTALATLTPLIKKPFGIKLPPYFDFAHFDQVAAMVNKYDNLAFVSCINAVGNALAIDLETETTLIKPKDGFGALAGRMVLNTALANVNAFYRRLAPGKQVIGVGGVVSGKEAFLHILAGASAVQIGTQLMEEGPAIFDRVIKELEDIMEKKGYQSIEEFRGKVKTL